MKVTFKVNAQDNKKLLRMLALSNADLIRIQREVYEQLGKNFVQHTKNKYLSRKDHSLKELAQLGHPYAKNRKGKRRELLGALGHPIYQVHRHEGDFYDAMIFQLIGEGGRGNLKLYAGIDKELDDLAVWLHEGTTKMIRRPFLHLAFRDKGPTMRKRAMRDLRTSIIKLMKERYGKG